MITVQYDPVSHCSVKFAQIAVDLQVAAGEAVINELQPVSLEDGHQVHL